VFQEDVELRSGEEELLLLVNVALRTLGEERLFVAAVDNAAEALRVADRHRSVTVIVLRWILQKDNVLSLRLKRSENSNN
jgi:hypothetical protein